MSNDVSARGGDAGFEPSFPDGNVSAAPDAPARRFGWQRFGGKFLAISVLAHVVFFVVAGYFIVQRVQAQRKLTFQSGPKGPSAPNRALEHKVQMRKKSMASAPPQAKRVTTTGIAKVALPDMPAMPSMTATLSPGAIGGMGAAGIAPGGLGSGSLGGMGGGNGGASINFFGVRTGGVGLQGTFYDLKQSSGRQPNGMTSQKYAQVVTQFLSGGFNAGVLNSYFKAPSALFATQIFIPNMTADKGPEAFELASVVKPSLWLVHYKGAVAAPDSGTYHFVGAGDDVLLVRFNGKLVLARDWDNPGAGLVETHWQPQANYDYGFSEIPKGFAKGDAIQVVAGQTYPMEVLIGEQPGGFGFAALLIEKEGEDYKKDGRGNPILPVFRLRDIPLPPAQPGMDYAPHAEGGPVWKSVSGSGQRPSIFDR